MNRTTVIGAGFGGLALAIRLQASGIPTRLLEKRMFIRIRATPLMPARR